ncbi:MAG: hypothetical protein JWS12_231 [Candidatus Saccharibacteria bacterium]|nr:hypothetical protein [Candidatus Saccharibacteria bacterium]
MVVGPENQEAIERFVNDVGEEVGRAARPYVDEIVQQTNIIFDIADFELAGLEQEIPPSQQSENGEISFLTETRLGLLDSKKIRKFEQTFQDGFYELQELGYSLTEDMPPEEIASISEAMTNLIGRLNLLSKVLAGRPVSGGRHACFYFTGREGEPEKAHRNLFANFPFNACVVGIEAVKYPGEEDGNYFVCMVVDPLRDSPVEHVKQEGERLNKEYPNSSQTIRERTWVPIGNIQFHFGYVPSHRAEAETAI